MNSTNCNKKDKYMILLKTETSAHQMTSIKTMKKAAQLKNVL